MRYHSVLFDDDDDVYIALRCADTGSEYMDIPQRYEFYDNHG